MNYGEAYFWTDTIKVWKHLLKKDKYKELILSSWKELIRRQQVIIYAFVIMPNHLHVIWEMKEPNGKEMAHASFNKFTSHMILKDLRINHPNILYYFQVEETERSYRFWQRDPLAVLMDSKVKMEQKISRVGSAIFITILCKSDETWPPVPRIIVGHPQNFKNLAKMNLRF